MYTKCISDYNYCLVNDDDDDDDDDMVNNGITRPYYIGNVDTDDDVDYDEDRYDDNIDDLSLNYASFQSV